MPHVRQKAKERTRKRLISAAIRLFAQKGLDGPSLDEICAEAGVTRGALYVHFEDRDALLASVMDEVGNRFLETFFQAGEGTHSLLGAFAKAMNTGDYPLTRRGGMRPHQLLDACARSRPIRKKYVELVHRAIDLLSLQVANDQGKKKMRSDLDPRAISTVMLMLAIGAHTLVDLEADVDALATVNVLERLLR